ncbi:MAG: CapA family protein [Deltaproteobacteria bacterium]|nr:CapA family protein [Deltaproteobacteria bacterium]
MYKGTLAVAGECMCTRPFSMHREPEFLELIKLLREADASYCHMEMNIFPLGGSYPGRSYAVSALQAEPAVAHDLKWAGIDLVSCAYNHALDWGLPGMLGTIASLDDAGIVNAGLGNNLEEAREPAYFESPAGRVAIVSMSSGNHGYDSASPAAGPSLGRPGVNPMRVDQKYVVSKQSLENLKAVWEEIGLPMKPRYFSKMEDGDVCFNYGDHGGGLSGHFVFRAGDKPGVLTIPDEWDLAGNLRAIRDAKRQADLVIVAHHAAVNDGLRGEKPAQFVPAFARQCIDAGADVFVGHGWHRQLGIEMYKNKPIFYGTGNFFAQSQFLKRIPSDTYEGHGFSMADLGTLTPADLHDAREGHMAHWKVQPWGIVALLDVESGDLSRMKLYPFTLGYDTQGNPTRLTGTRMEGRPVLTSGKDAEHIIGYVKKLSAAYGTDIQYEDGVGILKIK